MFCSHSAELQRQPWRQFARSFSSLAVIPSVSVLPATAGAALPGPREGRRFRAPWGPQAGSWEAQLTAGALHKAPACGDAPRQPAAAAPAEQDALSGWRMGTTGQSCPRAQSRATEVCPAPSGLILQLRCCFGGEELHEGTAPGDQHCRCDSICILSLPSSFPSDFLPCLCLHAHDP